jgi:aspartate-semialdehyde dehydrogenase
MDMSKAQIVAVVGVTGVVGQEMLRVLSQRKFPVSKLVPIASPRSAGRKVEFNGEEHTVQAIAPELFEGVDIALFSAGGSTSLEWAPIAAKHGALVIDNSSAFRMDDDVPLCVPEVNLEAARNPARGIIANPNCSTIQLVVALKPIQDRVRLKRIVVATYQAISGAGAQASAHFQTQIEQLAKGETIEAGAIGGPLAGNLLMEWTVDSASGYQEEEIKLVRESRKILGDPDLLVSPTAVRVPVLTGHSEALTIEAHEAISAEQVRGWLKDAPGIELLDDFSAGIYPKPVDAAGQDPVFVGRIRDDIGNPGGVQMWVVSDNLRKGAALNAVQIAEGLTQ